MNNGYKNPWTSVSRPMNGFIDINENQWEQNELRKAQLAKDLQAQMAETKAKKDLARQLALAEEQAIERKLERQREELAQRELDEKRKAEDKNENRRLAALKFQED